PGHPERLDPNQVFGTESASVADDPFPGNVGIMTPLEPWAGVGAPGAETGVKAARPWAPPENQQVVKNSKDVSVVAPPCYDTNPMRVEIIDVINPGNVIHFNDVPEQETAVRAAAFKVYTCADATLQVTASP